MDEKIKQFILWKDNLVKSPFHVAYNGEDKSKPKVLYKKGNSDKDYTIEEVYQYYNENIFSKLDSKS